MTVVINLFGGPGAGKSRTAASIFAYLKDEKINCELVTEYAKELVWQGAEVLERASGNPLQLIAEQYRRMHNLRGKVDVIVTDSPLVLAVNYYKANEIIPTHLYIEMVKCLHDWFDNINVLLTYPTYYFNERGRTQSQVEAMAEHKKIELLINTLNLPLSVDWRSDLQTYLNRKKEPNNG